MGTYVARNAGSVRVGDLMIFDEDAGEERVVKISRGPAVIDFVRITGESGRELGAYVNDGVVLGVDDEPTPFEDIADRAARMPQL